MQVLSVCCAIQNAVFLRIMWWSVEMCRCCTLGALSIRTRAQFWSGSVYLQTGVTTGALCLWQLGNCWRKLCWPRFPLSHFILLSTVCRRWKPAQSDELRASLLPLFLFFYSEEWKICNSFFFLITVPYFLWSLDWTSDLSLSWPNIFFFCYCKTCKTALQYTSVIFHFKERHPRCVCQNLR